MPWGTGFNLPKGDPRAHLRNRFRNGFVSASQAPKRDSMYAVIVKAWNAYVAGESLTMLRFMASEGGRERPAMDDEEQEEKTEPVITFVITGERDPDPMARRRLLEILFGSRPESEAA
ncbi:hypothetical protein [Streptomyces sp. NPDC054804]